MKPEFNPYLIWTAALRSGKYKQTTNTLQTVYGFCCLGVACDVFIPRSLQTVNSMGLIMGLTPEQQIHSPEWLKQVSHQFYALTEQETSLMGLNDNEGFSFDEIADLIELVFVHKALGEP